MEECKIIRFYIMASGLHRRTNEKELSYQIDMVHFRGNVRFLVDILFSMTSFHISFPLLRVMSSFFIEVVVYRSFTINVPLPSKPTAKKEQL